MPDPDARARIRDTRYRPRGGPVPIEALDLVELRKRVDLEATGAERLHFHLVLAVLGGSGEHEVDFDRVALRPLQVLHVVPGQVHRWTGPHRYDARLFLLPDETDLRPPGPPVGARSRLLTPQEWWEAATLVPLIDRERDRDQPPERRDRALRALRELLVLRLGLDQPSAPAAGGDPAGLPPAYLAFRAELEARPTARSVAEVAAALGYAPRTLTRACLAATGRSAKVLLDERVFLEARRLLVHTDRTSAAVAAELGFSEATNFTAFFRRMSGLTPGRWRARQV